MAYMDKSQQIELLGELGINVQRTGGVNYSKAISANSPVVGQTADVIVGLMEKYASLDGLVKHGFRTQAQASDAMIGELSSARRDVKGWKEKNPHDADIKYASEALDETISDALQRMGVRDDYSIR